jgi:hypothetical protein
MKIIFEGTEDQIKNLKALVEFGSNDLPKIREDYQTENLWCIEDVKSKFKCDDDEALEVLESALTNEATMEQIWYAIEFHAEEMGLEEVN